MKFRDLIERRDDLTQELEGIAQSFEDNEGNSIEYTNISNFVSKAPRKDIRRVREMLSNLDDIDWDEDEGYEYYKEIVSIVSRY